MKTALNPKQQLFLLLTTFNLQQQVKLNRQQISTRTTTKSLNKRDQNNTLKTQLQKKDRIQSPNQKFLCFGHRSRISKLIQWHQTRSNPNHFQIKTKYLSSKKMELCFIHFLLRRIGNFKQLNNNNKIQCIQQRETLLKSASTKLFKAEYKGLSVKLIKRIKAFVVGFLVFDNFDLKCKQSQRNVQIGHEKKILEMQFTI